MGRLLLPLLALVATHSVSSSPQCADYPALEHGMCAGGVAGNTACAQQCSTAEEPANPGGGRCDHTLCMCDGVGLSGMPDIIGTAGRYTYWMWRCAEATVSGDPYYTTYSWEGFDAHLNGKHILTRSTSGADFGPITVYNRNVCKEGDCDVIGGGSANVQTIEAVMFASGETVRFDFQRDESGTTEIVVTVNGAAVTLPYSYTNGGGDEFFTMYRHSTDNVVLDTSVGVRVTCYAATDTASIAVPRTARFHQKFEGVLGRVLTEYTTYPPAWTMRNGTATTIQDIYLTAMSMDPWLVDWTEADGTTKKRSNNRERRCANPGVQRRVRALCKGKLARLAAQCKRGPYETAYGRRLEADGDRRALAKHQRELNKQAPGAVKKRLELAMQSCAADVCGSGNPCNAVANFEAFCASIKADVDFDKYHTANFCPRRQCPAASAWHDCAGCQPACGDEASGDGERRCAKQCLGAGCVCNKGRYFSEDEQQCVRANKCP